ncbi:MAG: DegT/DnrJ/EryC1/StrS family aminotransferase [Deltaproteobacteria bacterium]|nr:DegT/DnrJ/EryC1/StrS family aminotransferase [Deltaproteobacteria bacterium]
MSVPFLDLKTQHAELYPEIEKVVREAVLNAAFIGGASVNEFEKEFAAFCGTAHSVGVGSGTDALRFALTACGVKSGDEVITVPNTFIATTEAITQAGAAPVFVDIDPGTFNIDVDRIEEKITPKTKAIVPVHLYGQCADMDRILAIAKRRGLKVVEDACQAHGATYRGKMAGSMGDAAAFSFYPGKNLGACGEGGAITTSDDGVAAHSRMLRDHGQIKKYYHSIEGYNGRLDAIQAGILRVKLKRLGGWVKSRRKNAALYKDLLAGVEGISVQHEPDWAENAYHLFVIRVKGRDVLQERLSGMGVATALHYPVPLHLQDAYRHMGLRKGDFPVSEAAAEEILSLPMFPELTEEQIRYVVESIKKAL